MSVLWRKRLWKLAREQEWVKGAVNYDEDLHFSTYYLRASCSAVTAPLYPGYSCLVASFEGFNETYYLLKDECRATAAAIVGQALRRPGWLPRILEEIRRRSDALAGLFPAGVSPGLLARLPDARLLALYRRHDARHRSLYRYARLPEALDRGVSYFTDYLLGHLRGRGLDDRAAAEAFAVLSQPAAPSILAQEILEFDEIVRRALSQPGAVPPSADGPARARMTLDPDLYRRLDAHREKWQFLTYHGYGRRKVASLDHYLGRLLEQARDPGVLADGAGMTARCREAGRLRRQLLRRLRLDGPHRTLFELYPDIGAVKLYRRYAQLRNFHGLDMLLAEIARRLGVCEGSVRCMLPEEVIASLQSRRLAAPDVGRRLEGCMFTVVDGEEHIVTGAEAADLRRLLRPQFPDCSDPRVLHGVVACRGKVAGPCKVIIRADDCQTGFEKGTIIVSESTDPDLVRFLRAAGGVLTEQGGVTAHAAIICRELGVPTIIGIEGLLERVRDGDWVEMDAERGTVTLTESLTRPDREAPLLPPPEEIGAKAHTLAVVRSLGFRVPDFAVLGYEEARRVARRPGSQPNRRLVLGLLARLGLSNGDRLAIRSSAVAEDRADGSRAGQYRSLLNVPRDEVAAALRDFVASNGAGRNGNAYRGSVIVQRMVEADCAGVCLTREARTGHGDAVILEMTPGGNEGVTGGTARPDRVVVDRRTGDVLHEDRRGSRLRPRGAEISWLVRQFLMLEVRFGRPLDIEWALAGRELYILQARPIVEDRRAAGVGSVPDSGV